jgi:hypothetical protein
MKNPRYLATSIVVLCVTVLLGGFYLVSVGAEDREWDPHVDGPRPPSEIEDAPLIQLSAQQPMAALSTFDESTESLEDWERIQHDIVLPEYYGVWEMDSGKLVQKGTVAGPAHDSFDQTIFLAPTELAEQSIISVQVFPQGNQVVGLVFGATDQGHYHYRVFRQSREETDQPAVNHKLEYYNMQTDEYRVLAESDAFGGFILAEWQELRVELDGDVITCSFDGEQTIQVRPRTGRRWAGRCLHPGSRRCTLR